MQKFIVSAIIATTVTVGAYLVALAFGASELAAAIVAAVAAFVAATFVAVAFAAFAPVVTAVAVAAFAAATVATAAALAAFAIATVFAATVVTVAFAIATVAATEVFAAVAVAAAAAEQKGIKYWWAFAAYTLEAVAIGSAFMVNSAVWSIAIALSGVVALLVLWRFAPKPIATPDAPSASTVPESNGA